MALATYADLLSGIASYTKRGDTAALAPIWIALTEAKLNRELRTYQMLTRATAAISTEFTSPPADFESLRSARLIDSPYLPLVVLTAEQMASRRSEQRSGALDSLALIGTQLCANPVPTSTYNVELLYYAKVPALSATTTTSWVLTNHPDLYLWGTLAEAADFYEDDDQLTKFGSLFRDALTGANAQSVKAESSFALTRSPSSPAI